MKQLAEKREHEKEELQKATEENDVKKMAEQKLTPKTEAGEENRKTAKRTGSPRREPRRKWLPNPSVCERRTSTLRQCGRTKDPKILLRRLKTTSLRTGFLPIPFLNIQMITGQCHFTFALLTNILQADVGLYR